MTISINRREFLATTLVGAASIMQAMASSTEKGKRVGIIGLDTSHSTAFTKILNNSEPNPVYKGYKVVAAYPYGSKDIETSVARIPQYTEEVKKYGVEIVDSIEALLKKVDVVLLETNDGRRHLEQVLPVLKAKKRVFIDKPIAGSLKDVLAIFDASKKYGVPLFSGSSLRYIKGIEKIKREEVLGAEAYSPAALEKTHPDLFWYGIHGVETLYTIMGKGCKQVTRVHTPTTDVVVGEWNNGRVGTFRGTRDGKSGYGALAFTTEGNIPLGPYGGYEPLLVEIIKYFETGVPPIDPEETIELFTFMEAADESKRRGGVPVTLAEVLAKAK